MENPGKLVKNYVQVVVLLNLHDYGSVVACQAPFLWIQV